MTYREARDYIQCGAAAKCLCASNKKHGGDCPGENAVNEALEIAEDVLEMCCPKRPTVVEKIVAPSEFEIKRITKTNRLSLGACPKCLGTVDSDMNFCHKCGQALDWRDD